VFIVKSNMILSVVLSSIFASISAGCVSDKDELLNVLQNAHYGDEILICDGDYTKMEVDIKVDGVEVRAETPGHVVLHDASYVHIEADHSKISGLRLHGGGSVTPIKISGDYNVVSECAVYSHHARRWVEIKGNYNTIERCRLSNKTASGNLTTAEQMVVVWYGEGYGQFNRIINNKFLEFQYKTPGLRRGNGYEVIRIGTSGHQWSDAHAEIEGNYFYRVDAEAETICLKTQWNRVEKNAFEEVKGSISLRHGSYNMVIGNVFYGKDKSNTRGVRIFGKHHEIRNNWFSRLSSGALLVYHGQDEESQTGHVAAENITIVSNSIVGCKEGLNLGADYEVTPRTPILLVDNQATGDQQMIRLHDCPFQFQGENYFYGPNLGWPTEQELPESLIWESSELDFGSYGDMLLQEIKCNSGPSWEQDRGCFY